MQQKELTRVNEELAHHCATAIREAYSGNQEARRWLAEAFPGNADQFDRLWSGEKIVNFDRTCRPKRREEHDAR